MESLTDKLRLLKKVITEGDLSRAIPEIQAIPYGHLNDSITVLMSNGINIKSWIHIKLLAYSPEELERRIVLAKEQGITDKIKKNPLYLMNSSVFAVKRTKDSADERKTAFSPMDPALSANGGQTIDTARFDKLQTMTSCVNGVFELLADESVSKEGVFTNLEKNILSGDYPNDMDLLFHTITDGKGYSEDTLGKIKEAVQVVLKNIKER
jgi:hypothetical protein